MAGIFLHLTPEQMFYIIANTEHMFLTGGVKSTYMAVW